MRLSNLLARRFVSSYLYRRREQLLARYPQMCCYALDTIAMHLSLDGRYEREELEFILTRFDGAIRGRTVLDVGANIGNHTLAFAERAARVVALEPHPVTFRLLELNVREAANVTPLNLGASDRRAELEAAAPIGNAGACRIGRAGPGDPVLLVVQPVDELAGLEDVGLVKIDVEGHEAEAIRGMRRLLGDQSPLVILEQNADSIADGTSAAVALLAQHGYAHLYSIEKRHPWRFPLGRAGHVLEALLLGIPPLEGALVPVARLQPRDYPCLVASKRAL